MFMLYLIVCFYTGGRLWINSSLDHSFIISCPHHLTSSKSKLIFKTAAIYTFVAYIHVLHCITKLTLQKCKHILTAVQPLKSNTKVMLLISQKYWYQNVCTRGSLTICMHSDYEVIPHAFGLPQLVGVTIVHHVITAETERKDDSFTSMKNNRYSKHSNKNITQG